MVAWIFSPAFVVQVQYYNRTYVDWSVACGPVLPHPHTHPPPHSHSTLPLCIIVPVILWKRKRQQRELTPPFPLTSHHDHQKSGILPCPVYVFSFFFSFFFGVFSQLSCLMVFFFSFLFSLQQSGWWYSVEMVLYWNICWIWIAKVWSSAVLQQVGLEDELKNPMMFWGGVWGLIFPGLSNFSFYFLFFFYYPFV